MKWFILAVVVLAFSLVASDAKAHQRFRRAVVPRQVVVREPVVVRRFVAPVPVYGFNQFSVPAPVYGVQQFAAPLPVYGVQSFSSGGCQGFFGY